ncbi:MAG: RDD family protein [Acidimicrobiia bacterium]|nr:RDD family protein [Acidimicrobiia bacterium]
MTFKDEEPAARDWDPKTTRVALPDRRLLGFLIDAVILLVISLPAVALILGGGNVFDTDASGIPIELSLTLEVISGVYYVGFTGLRGQTPGKMVMKTQVVDWDRGRVPSWTQAFIRWGVIAAVGAVPVFGLMIFAMYAWLLFDKRRQGLHDKAAKTLVVDLRPRIEDL